MFTVELNSPIDNGITSVYVANCTANGNNKVVTCIVEKDPYREEYIFLPNTEMPDFALANLIRDYYQNNRSFIDSSYFDSHADSWNQFSQAMLANVEFNQVTGYLLSAAPALAIAMPTALAQVLINDVTAFSVVFNMFCQYGNVSNEQRLAWSDIAQGFDLPQEFINAVRGI